MIVVSPLSRLSAVAEAYRPVRCVSLRSPDAETPADAKLSVERLELVFHDIADDRPDLVAPKSEQVAALIAFGRAWDQRGPLLVHCYAGISRSTAAAFILAAALEPERDEGELAGTLRRLSPSATPNPYLVRLADALLGRGGRMIAAVERIGRGAEAFEGKPFALPLIRPVSPY